MIYLFSKLDTLQGATWTQALSLLSDERREYVLHFRQDEDQKRSAIGWLLLAYGLKQEYGIQMPPAFCRTSNGKPYFPEKNMPFFNLSHSGNMVGCAIHPKEIGLDIQKLVTPRPSLIRRVCTDEELALVEDSEAPSMEFCRIWSQKESAVKLTGEGITGNFRDVLTTHPDICTRSFSLGDATVVKCGEVEFGVAQTFSNSIIPAKVISATAAVLSYSTYTSRTFPSTDTLPILEISPTQLL